MASALIDWDLATGAFERERWIGRRTRGAIPVSRPAMSCPRLPARAPFTGRSLNSLPQFGGKQGACIDGEDRVCIELLSDDRCFERSSGRWFGDFGSNLLSGGGLNARLRGQAQVVAASPLLARRGMCRGRVHPRQPEKAPWIERRRRKRLRPFMKSFQRLRLWSWRTTPA